MKKYRNLFSIILVGVSLNAFAGQGVFLRLNGYVPGTGVRLNSQSCMAVAPQLTTALTSSLYVENSSSFRCLFRNGNFKFSLINNFNYGEVIADYNINVGFNATNVVLTYANPRYLANVQFYPHSGERGSQDSIIISSSQLKASDWVGSLPASLKLRELSLAGSHDSGSSAINNSSDLANDVGNVIAELYRLDPTKFSRQVIAGWSQTQQRSVAQQLEAGIRYFDLRVCLKATGGDVTDINQLVTCHGLVGQRLVDILQQVAAFGRAHPNEIIALDFNHWYTPSLPAANTAVINGVNQSVGAEDLMRKTVADYILTSANSPLKDLVVSRKTYSMASTLGQLRQARRNVLLFTNNNGLFGDFFLSRSVYRSGSLWQCPGADFCSMWADTADSNELVRQIKDTVNFMTANADRNYWFDLGMNLTPTQDLIIRGLIPASTNPGSLLKFATTYHDKMLNSLNALINVSRICTVPGNNLNGIIFGNDFAGIDEVEMAVRCSHS